MWQKFHPSFQIHYAASNLWRHMADSKEVAELNYCQISDTKNYALKKTHQNDDRWKMKYEMHFFLSLWLVLTKLLHNI